MQILPPKTFTPGLILTAADLNAHVGDATLTKYAVHGQTSVASFDIQSDDEILVYDASADALRRAMVDDIFRAGTFPIKTQSISGISGYPLTISIASDQILAVNGNTNISGNFQATGNATFSSDLSVNGNATIQGTLIVNNSVEFRTNTAIKIPASVTGNRPSAPARGHFRYNTTNEGLEYYNGTEWLRPGGLPLSSITETTMFLFTNTQTYTWQVGFESVGYTKPSSELWIVEIDTCAACYGRESLSEVQFKLKNANTILGYDMVWSNHFGGSNQHIQHITFKYIFDYGTTFTNEQFQLLIKAAGGTGVETYSQLNTADGPRKFRIYKYKA